MPNLLPLNKALRLGGTRGGSRQGDCGMQRMRRGGVGTLWYALLNLSRQELENSHWKANSLVEVYSSGSG